MDPFYFVSKVQVGAGGVMVWGAFSWPTLGTLGPTEPCLCHSLPEYFCWPCPSLYDYSVPIFWWLLPAGQSAISQIWPPNGLYSNCLHSRQISIQYSTFWDDVSMDQKHWEMFSEPCLLYVTKN